MHDESATASSVGGSGSPNESPSFIGAFKVLGVLAKLALGIRTLASLTILVGIAVLVGAISTSGMRRSREAALLKTLGVTRRGVASFFAVEYALVGLVAGTIGAAGAWFGSWLFLDLVVLVEPELPLLPPVLFALGSAAASTLCGLFASTRAIASRPLATLRG